MKRIGTVICLVLAIVLLAIGIDKGQPEAVLAKAAKICLECVGIG